MRLLIGIILLLNSCAALAQTGEKKYEKESRIKEDQLPPFMHETLKPYLNSVKKLKYYKEFDGETNSYEAKFIYYKNICSVEFTDQGKLKDVEIHRFFTELPIAVQDTIIEFLNHNKDFKIIKTQKQFTTESMPDSTLLKSALNNANVGTIRYELIAEIKEDKDWKTFELLFDKNGEFLQKREVLNRSEDYLLYR